MESAVKNKPGRPRKQYDYSVHAYFKKNGRMTTEYVCTLPAENEKFAKIKGENFCTMAGFDFSHTKLA